MSFLSQAGIRPAGPEVKAPQAQGQITSSRPAQGISLAITVPKPDAVRGGSIPFTITLTNSGKNPVSVRDGSPGNSAFMAVVSGPRSFTATGNAASIRAREGEHLDVPRTESRRTLQPGEKLEVAGDLISWIGDLAPGAYRFTAMYSGGPQPQNASSPAEIRIREAAVVYARPVRNLTLLQEPRDIAWINRSGAGYDLFLLRSSPYAPPVTYSNRRIAWIGGAFAAAASAYNEAGQAVRHIVWITPAGVLQAVRLQDTSAAGAALTFPLAARNQEIIGTPFTSRQGTLFVVLAAPDAEAILMAWKEGADPVVTPLGARLPAKSPRSLLWYRDESLVLAMTGADRKDASTVTVPLNRVARPALNPKAIAGTLPIVDITLAQRIRENDAGEDHLAVILSFDAGRNEFRRRRINLRSGAVEADEGFSAGPVAAMTLVDTALDWKLSPRYLFAGKDGAVFFVTADFARVTPLVTPAGKPVRTTDLPALEIASEFSKLPGTYVRYIDEGKRFLYIRIP